MTFTLLVTGFLVLLVLHAFDILLLERGTNKLLLPPGPKGLPVIGNVRDLPPPGEKEYLHWLKLKDAYGPISSLTVMGNEPYATNVTFGLGLRRCPGHLFADASLFLIMAQALAVFDVKPSVDEEEKEVELTHGFEAGVIGIPEPFEIRLLPRSEVHKR